MRTALPARLDWAIVGTREATIKDAGRGGIGEREVIAVCGGGKGRWKRVGWAADAVVLGPPGDDQNGGLDEGLTVGGSGLEGPTGSADGTGTRRDETAGVAGTGAVGTDTVWTGNDVIGAGMAGAVAYSNGGAFTGIPPGGMPAAGAFWFL